MRTPPSPSPSPSPSPKPADKPPALYGNATYTNATTNATVDAIGITNTTQLLNSTAGQLLNVAQLTRDGSNLPVDAQTTGEAGRCKPGLWADV